MLSHDNIEKSFLVPSRGKRNRPDVAKVLDNLENEIKFVYDMLRNNEFTPTKHKSVKINEKNYQKERTIVKPDYKYEQVVHHVVVNTIRPGIESGMYEYVLGSIPGRGQHMGAKVITKWIRTDPVNTKYVFKGDIRHFFESIDHRRLKRWIRRKFRDEYIIELMELIIDAVDMGLPLGYYTSQWFANFLLQPLDHYIKETLHVKYYTRYMDDIVLFGANKKELHRVKDKVEEYLMKELGLTLKGNWQVFRFEYTSEEYCATCGTLEQLRLLGESLDKLRIRNRTKMYKGKRRIYIKKSSVRSKTDKLLNVFAEHNATYEIVTMTCGRPLDYMGFEFHRNKTIMREGIMIRLNRKARQVSKQEHINPKDAQSLLSSLGWVKHTDTYGMYEDRIKPIINVKKLKKVVSKDSKRRNATNQKNAKERDNK